MPRRPSTAATPAAPQTTLAPGAWPFGMSRPASTAGEQPAAAPGAPAPESAATTTRTMVSFDNVKVQKGVPIPGRAVRSTNAGQELLTSMEPGDMVRVTEAQAKTLGFAARRAKVRITTRRLSATELGVWRVE